MIILKYNYVLFRVRLFVEIPEDALDKFRGGAEEFIAGTRVFPPKSPIGGTLNIL